MVKHARHAPYGLLTPIEAADKPFGDWSIDFVTGLPDSQGFNAVMVCIDRLTRVAHFIPTTKSVTAEESAQLFLENVVKLHGVPVRVLSDHGPQFIAKFWKKLWKAMDIDLSYSSAYHPQGNGLVERVNQALESYLRAYVSEAEDWARLLWLCEFTYNNTVHAAIQCSPFMAMYGFQPEMDEINFKSPKAPQTAADRVEELKALRFSLRANIHRANMSAAKFYDRHHKAAPPITVGSLVTVLRRSQTAEQPYAKLAYVRDGPFKVVKQINERAFELDLGEASSKSRTFHVSVLELFVADDVEGRIRRVLPPVKDWDGTVRHRVEAVIDSTRHSEIMYYRIRRVGTTAREDTWEPAKDVRILFNPRLVARPLLQLAKLHLKLVRHPLLRAQWQPHPQLLHVP
ncbi:hypothetical protein CAOG_08987 [Capsaspora owczarzaki ATCC 30864]|uniref:hypothetical protein n=1 Tax=Capsaspora owczarzaki (strain ATCC 30864) TaxID=595528 RepID=UPI00035267FC|nr:hypothetical protein CAOG_08987 [Capsaspora owczarzaki ATCC 30864]|eukprot:XP_011270665.1 hypothetical protein CAOG_08987 [Capsaspora owczarzaki ATCC 30864]